MAAPSSPPARRSKSRRSQPRTPASTCARSSRRAVRTPTRRDDRQAGGQVGRAGLVENGARRAAMMLLVAIFSSPGLTASPAFVAAQPSFDEAMRDLKSSGASTRLRAVQGLQELASAEAALPIAPLLNDPQNDVQLAAIAAEMSIFLAEPVVPRRRVGFVVEVRNSVAAEAAFTAGLFALGTRPVPLEVLTALRLAARDDNPRVALEALY